MIKLLRKYGFACVTAASLCLATTAHADTAEIDLESEQLRLILTVPKLQWHGPLKAISEAMEAGNKQQAATELNQWLKQDPAAAVQALPHMKQYPFYFDEFIQSQTFADYLLNKGGVQAMESLALLNFDNSAVSNVGFDLLHGWWNKDPKGLANWIKATPAFLYDLQIEELIRRITAGNEGYEALANLFYKLEATDPRRERFFAEVLDAWLALDPQSTIAFMEQLKRSSREPDISFDKAALRIAYFFSNNQQQAEALEWVLEVDDVSTREVGIRDFAYAINSAEQLQVFGEWYSKQTLTTEMIVSDIDAHLLGLVQQQQAAEAKQ